MNTTFVVLMIEIDLNIFFFSSTIYTPKIIIFCENKLTQVIRALGGSGK